MIPRRSPELLSGFGFDVFNALTPEAPSPVPRYGKEAANVAIVLKGLPYPVSGVFVWFLE